MGKGRKRALRVIIITSAFVGAAVVSTDRVVGQGTNFVGGNPTYLDVKELKTFRLRFVAGSRSNWHVHSHGQLLMAEAGRLRTQERGGPLRETGPGEPVFMRPGVEHWHGAGPDQGVVQLAVYEGTVKPLQPVSDAEYKVKPQIGR